MRWIVLLGGLVLLTLQPAQAGHSAPKVFLRIYVQTSGEGLPATQATQIALPPNGETILIRSMPEVTERELVAVEPDASGAVHLHFNHEGQINLDAVTAQNQGRIMVVMLNGTIIYAPVIDEQLSNGELVLPHSLPPQVVQLLQDIAKKNVAEHART